jgi:hypothetical protein
MRGGVTNKLEKGKLSSSWLLVESESINSGVLEMQYAGEQGVRAQLGMFKSLGAATS